MSTAVKSDGTVNAAVLTLAQNGFVDAKQKQLAPTQVDAMLTEAVLRQCKHETLCLAMYAYVQAFQAKNWAIQKHLEIKAWQSEPYRNFMGGRKLGSPAPAIANGLNGDPIATAIAILQP